MISDKIQDDLKQAMLARDSLRVQVLRGIKSAILYAEVALSKRDSGLSEEEIISVLKKEAKKRNEAMELYQKAGNDKKFSDEQQELEIINGYLPAPMGEDELLKIIENSLIELNIVNPEKKDTGRIISLVREKAGSSADGSMIASLVNRRIAE